MGKKSLTLLILWLSLICGCDHTLPSSPEIPKAEVPDILYNSKVKVVKGFHKGRTGVAISEENGLYAVMISDTQMIMFNREELEPIK